MNKQSQTDKKVNVAITGAGGRMGSALIEMILAENRFQIVGLLEEEMSTRIGNKITNLDGSTVKVVSDPIMAFSKAECIIDFSLPEGTMTAVKVALSLKIPMVIGTTGLSSDQMRLLDEASQKIAIVHAPNMSYGINLMRVILKEFIHLLPDDYDVEIIERHHRRKRDSPSGTAIDLAEIIHHGRNRYANKEWMCGRARTHEPRAKNDLVVHPVRGGEVIGEHRIYAMGDAEEIVITHRAFNRNVFIIGALKAALFVVDAKPGLFSMEQVIKKSR